jgi:hypothetical protein
MEFYASITPVSSWAELKTQAENPGGPALLALTHDVVLDNTLLAITVKRTLTITSFKGTHTISRGQDNTTAFYDPMFKVENGGNLTLGGYAGKTLILDGGAVWNESTPSQNDGVYTGIPLVLVENADLTIRDGAILRNNDSSGDGGGVQVLGANGTATMTMTGGAISGNRADGSYGGGGVYVESLSGGSVTMTMTGGTISGNTADYFGGGVEVHGDGGTAILNMTGGTISGNRADFGGGVEVYGDDGTATLNMTGGTISKNTAGNSGGGVDVYGEGGTATLNMRGGAIISGNEATDAGGVYVRRDVVGSVATMTMTGGTINGTRADGDGGGVQVYGSPAPGTTALTMRGGAISGNTANDQGGGVYVFGLYSGDTVTMTGGVISGNTASSEGGGVFVYVYPINQAVFKKENEGSATTSGIIYGGTEPDLLKNTASAGHAVYVFVNDSPPTFKKRDATVPEGEELDSSIGSSGSGGWE